jgi:hypothetical protein
MSTLQDDGRIGETEAFINLPLFIAWGRGNPAWDALAQPEPTDANALVDEIGRRLVTQAQFVVPDANGEIEFPESKYKVSAVPTKWAYVRVVFDFDDAVGETVRELGVFFGSTVDPELPPGQRYFLPDQVVTPGRLKLLHRLENKIIREGGVRQSFDYVLPF